LDIDNTHKGDTDENKNSSKIFFQESRNLHAVKTSSLSLLPANLLNNYASD
jgi:hypothetical protein